MQGGQLRAGRCSATDRRNGLGLHLVEQQDGAAKQLRFVDRVAGRAGRADEEPRGERAVAVALRGLGARLEQRRMIGREAQSDVDELFRLVGPPEIAQHVRLRAQRLRALPVLIEQGFLALVQRERPVVTAGPGEQPPCGLEIRPVLRIEQERVLVADRGALRVAELIDEDASHRKMHLRRRGGGPERADLRFELRQGILGSADLRIRRVALRRWNRKLLGGGWVHAHPNRTRPLPVQSASARGKRSVVAEPPSAGAG